MSEQSSDYEFHSAEAQDWGQSHGTQHTHAILAVAASVQELIALLRPLVDTVTVKPEPLVLRTDGTEQVLPCLAGDPNSGGFRRCTEPYGHDGDHRHASTMTSVEYVWTQRHGDVPKRCGARAIVERIGRTCALDAGHTGVHADGDLDPETDEPVTW